ncbi:MAG: type III-A CRISPR-associated RAMP protein Csm4 [Dialister invisus]|uniref:type III-A CRISPR-associated RAMP protein Csm4 n=1 Tax=Dialister invisus TaxID=218538 RepID=UPI0026773EBB|nr:type III-A CRISPR-associated RAMP protein Csm4 [Dialister invisus]
MRYEIILFRFTSPVHFGDAAEGGDLGEILSYCRADTFFSALCREAADISQELLACVVEGVQRGKLRFSDLFPWKKGTSCYELYLPRPVMNLPHTEQAKTLSYEEVREQSGERKKYKKRSFIRASEMESYLQERNISAQPDFGKEELRTQYNAREKRPYGIGAYHFMPDAGLYLILSGDEELAEKLEPLIKLLGMAGIGGKRSSGFGKYIFEDDPLDLSDENTYGGDDVSLYKMLCAGHSNCYMALSSFLPEKLEVGDMSSGTGKIIKRGGFAWSREMTGPAKVSSVYMMASGSCFSKRLEGRIADVNNGSVPHPVYKYGKGLFVGLPL